MATIESERGHILERLYIIIYQGRRKHFDIGAASLNAFILPFCIIHVRIKYVNNIMHESETLSPPCKTALLLD